MPGAQALALLAEFAGTLAERSHGMMGGLEHAEAAAMLFAVAEDKPALFWMRNTPLTLDIAFFDKAGPLVHLEIAAEPMSKRLLTASGETRTPHALELPAGAATRYGLAVGMSRIEVGETLPCPPRSEGGRG